MTHVFLRAFLVKFYFSKSHNCNYSGWLQIKCGWKITQDYTKPRLITVTYIFWKRIGSILQTERPRTSQTPLRSLMFLWISHNNISYSNCFYLFLIFPINARIVKSLTSGRFSFLVFCVEGFTPPKHDLGIILSLRLPA